MEGWDGFGILREGWASGVRLRELALVLVHNYDVSNSKFLTIGEIDDNAAGRATSNGGLAEISRGAALATVNKEGASATHLIGLLRIEVE